MRGLVLALREARRLGAEEIDLRLDSKLIVEQCSPSVHLYLWMIVGLSHPDPDPVPWGMRAGPAEVVVVVVALPLVFGLLSRSGGAAVGPRRAAVALFGGASSTRSAGLGRAGPQLGDLGQQPFAGRGEIGQVSGSGRDGRAPAATAA